MKSKLSFILLEKGDRPRYLEVNKSTIRFFFNILPIVTVVLVILILLAMAYFKNISLMAEKKVPRMIEEMKSETTELKKKIEDLSKINSTLENKLANQDIKQLFSLALFRPVPGQQDVSNIPSIDIQEVEIAPVNQNVIVQFNLKNITTEAKKVSGYIFIKFKSKEGIQFYPETALLEDDVLIPFNKGESFTTSRFRPVKAIFARPNIKGTIYVEIIIFTRSGDLMKRKILTHILS